MIFDQSRACQISHNRLSNFRAWGGQVNAAPLCRLGGFEDVAQTQLHLLQSRTGGCLLAVCFYQQTTKAKTTMEGMCNIQVLLRAAEFVERRERGECLWQLNQGGSCLLLKQPNTQRKPQQLYMHNATPRHNAMHVIEKIIETVAGRLFWASFPIWLSDLHIGASLYSKARSCRCLKMSPSPNEWKWSSASAKPAFSYFYHTVWVICEGFSAQRAVESGCITLKEMCVKARKAEHWVQLMMPLTA